MLFFILNREDFSFVIHLDRQPRTSRRREAQTGSRARSGSRSERTLDAVEHSRTLMEWWPVLIFHRGGLRIKVINNTPPHRTQRAAFPHYALLHTSREGLCDLSSRGVFRRIYEISNSVICEQSDSRVHPSPSSWYAVAFFLSSSRVLSLIDSPSPSAPSDNLRQPTDQLGIQCKVEDKLLPTRDGAKPSPLTALGPAIWRLVIAEWRSSLR